MKIKDDEHVLIAGRTGSGKTQLARVYLAGVKNVVVLDTKGRFSWPEVPGTQWEKGIRSSHRLVEGGKNLTLVTRLDHLKKARTPKIIYRPVHEEMHIDYYNEFYRWCYLRQNTTVYTDEVMSVCKNHQTYPEFLKAIMTRGRELRVVHWGSTQRPANIAVVAISEATHFFVFDLNMESDRKKLTEISGCLEFMERPQVRYGKYSFWYYHVERDVALPARLKL